jgi:hypothetical protein
MKMSAFPLATKTASLIEKETSLIRRAATVPAGFGSSHNPAIVGTVADPTCFIDDEGKIKKVEYHKYSSFNSGSSDLDISIIAVDYQLKNRLDFHVQMESIAILMITPWKILKRCYYIPTGRYSIY